MGHLFDLIRESNRAMDHGELSANAAGRVLANFKRVNAVLALEPEARSIPGDVIALVDQRQAARAAKNWAESDRLRDEIAKLGWAVKDTKDGPKLTPR